MNREDEVDILRELVQIANESKDFYESALKKFSNAEVRNVFQRMAEVKRELINVLSPYIVSTDEKLDLGGSFVGNVRETYADILASISSNDDSIYTAQLEETEDRLLKNFYEALDKVQSVETRTLLERYLPKVQSSHDEMRRLKIKLNA